MTLDDSVLADIKQSVVRQTQSYVTTFYTHWWTIHNCIINIHNCIINIHSLHDNRLLWSMHDLKNIRFVLQKYHFKQNKQRNNHNHDCGSAVYTNVWSLRMACRLLYSSWQWLVDEQIFVQLGLNCVWTEHFNVHHIAWSCLRCL